MRTQATEIRWEALRGLSLDALLTQLVRNGYEVEFGRSGDRLIARLAQAPGPLIGVGSAETAWEALVDVLVPAVREGEVLLEWRDGMPVKARRQALAAD